MEAAAAAGGKGARILLWEMRVAAHWVAWLGRRRVAPGRVMAEQVVYVLH